MDEEKTETHPSWGMMSISRTTGGGHNLFGSNIDHHASIRIKVSQASRRRSLSTNWYHPDAELIEIEMSPVQWAEALTTLGTVGTPVTIRRINRVRVDECPITNERRVIEEEFAKKISGTLDGLKRHCQNLSAKLAQKALTKADKTELLNECSKALTELQCNVPFIHDQFREAVEKTVGEAKAAIDAFYTHSVIEAGIASLGNQKQDVPNLAYDGETVV